MKVTIPRGAIREAVTGFSKVITGRQSIPVLGCVRLHAEQERGCFAEATDLDQVIGYGFNDASIDGEGSCLLPLSVLKDLSKGTGSEHVDIDASDPLSVNITNHVGSHVFDQLIAGMDPAEWPEMQTGMSTAPAVGFPDAYRKLIPFSSKDATRQVLNSVCVEVGSGDKPVTMAATDGRRLACFNSMAFPLGRSVILPITKFLTWTKLPQDSEIGTREDNEITWFGLKAGAFTYEVKCVDGIYPDYRQVIPAEPGPNTVTFDDEDAALLCQVLSVFPGGDEVILVGDDGQVTLYGRDAYADQWTTLVLEHTAYEGERTFVGLDRRFLLDAMAAGFREFSIRDSLSPLLSRDDNGGTHVLMPLWVDNPLGDEEPEADTEAVTDAPAAPVTTEPDEPEKAKAKPATRRKNTVKQTQTTEKAPAQDRVVAACETARVKIREAGQALTELSRALRDVQREQKAQAKEVEAAKAAIQKVQSLKLAA